MNIFRLCGDLAHVLAIIILLLKIWKTRSCSGNRYIITIACFLNSRQWNIDSNNVKF